MPQVYIKNSKKVMLKEQKGIEMQQLETTTVIVDTRDETSCSS